jgi:hypothetical protein
MEDSYDSLVKQIEATHKQVQTRLLKEEAERE